MLFECLLIPHSETAIRFQRRRVLITADSEK